MKKNFLIVLTLLSGLLVFYSCKKEFDTPEVKSAAEANKINIANIKAKFTSNINYKFKSDSNLYCVITADEVSGNLYKDVYVKDVTGALHVKFIASGGFFIGDSIRINLQGAILNEYNDLIQLDSVDSENKIVKLASGDKPVPIPMTIAQINAAGNIATNGVQSKLVRIDNVEFIDTDRNMPYADADGKASLNRFIRSCDGQTLTVRTSGYSSFVSKLTPSGNGSIIGIVSQFGTTMQLILRSNEEVTMIGPLCTGTPTIPPTGNSYLSKNFNDASVTSGGWLSYTVTNSAVKWGTSSFSGSTYAKISGFVNSANSNSESWLISPAIDLSTSTNPVLNFMTAAAKFAGTPLDVLVSANYTGGAPSSATWTSLNCVLSPTTTSYVWTSSGDVSLTANKTSSARIAFKYTSTTAGACTYELDDIIVKEK